MLGSFLAKNLPLLMEFINHSHLVVLVIKLANQEENYGDLTPLECSYTFWELDILLLYLAESKGLLKYKVQYVFHEYLCTCLCQ